MVESIARHLKEAAATFLEGATGCAAIEALDSKFLDFAQKLGFQSGMFVHLSRPGAPIKPHVVFGDNAPWIRHYAEQNYANIDPTIPRVFRSREPFTWYDAERPDGSRRQKRFFGEAREVWAEDGLIVPIHGPFGEVSVVNLLSETKIHFAEEDMAVLHAVCSIYASVGLNLLQGPLPGPTEPAPALSRRERQCVYYMCMGKLDAETAHLLGISIHTARGYLNSAKVKLGCESRPEMSLKALSYGMLVPDQGMML